MEDFQRWSEQLLSVEEQLGVVYDQLNELKRELKNSGRKKDVGALDEAMQKIGRYGQLFGEMRGSWSGTDD